MNLNLPEKATFSELASFLASKTSEIDDMYLVVPFTVTEKSLKVVNDDVHMMIVGKDGTEVEVEIKEQDDKLLLKALEPSQRNIIHESRSSESKT